MKTRLLLLSLLFCASSLISCEFFLGPSIPSGSISGYVMDAETLEMLADVDVTLTGGANSRTTTTDDTGYFQFTEVSTDSIYAVAFSRKEDYFDTAWNNILVEKDKDTALYDPVGLNPGLLLVPKRLHAEGELKVSGTVKYAGTGEGIPMPQIVLRPGIDTWSSDGANYSNYYSDLTGEYSIQVESSKWENGIHPGYFTLDVIADGYAPEYYVVLLLPGVPVTIDAELLTYEEVLL